MANAHDVRNLSTEIENAYYDRTKWINMMYSSGKKQKKERIAEDKARAAANRDLQKDVISMVGDFNEQDKVRAADVMALEEATDKMIANFTAETKARAEHMAQMMADFNAEDKARAVDNETLKENVGHMLAGFRNEREEAARAWKDLLKNMAAARAPKAKPKAAPTIPETGPEPETKPPREPEPEEKTMDDRHKKMIEVLNNNPDGLSLAHIGKELGVHFVTLAAPIKVLETEGKVEKRDGLYFLK